MRREMGSEQGELISVIVPIYKVEPYIRKCVESILCQTYRNLEIILVDDGSPDRCGEICEEYAKKDNRVRVIHQKNQGLSGARNTGLDAALGKYIGFVDSDDFIADTMYEKLYHLAKKYQSQIAICGRYYEFENGKRVKRYKEKMEVKCYSNKDAIVAMNSYSTFDMAAWDKLYEKNLWKEMRFPVGKLSEDFFVMYQLLDHAERVVYTPEPLYFYRQRQDSISRNKKINFDFIEAARNQMNYLCKKYPDLEKTARTAYASANLTVYNFHLKNKVSCPKDRKQTMKQQVKENLSYVMENKDISAIKKMQTWLFVYSTGLYDRAFCFLRKIKPV